MDRAALAGTYSYSVAAVDAAGNIGSRGTSLSVVYDTTAPARPTGLAGATPTNVAPALTWSRVLDGTVYVPRYAVLRGGVEIGTTTAAAFTDSALAVDGYAVYTVLAIDAAGNRSAASTSLTIRRDATPPVTPTGLATAAVTRTPPALAWAVAGDADGYRVYRSGALVGTVTAGAFTDASAPEGTWTYTVVAFDVAGNASAATAGAVATLDTTPPPATPVATAGAELTNGAPTLAWSASPGVVAWEVQRDGVAIATVSTPGYADAGVLADATVAYRLVAVDAAGNRSAASAAVAITVDRVAPAAPTGLAGATPTRDAPSCASAPSRTPCATPSTGTASASARRRRPRSRTPRRPMARTATRSRRSTPRATRARAPSRA